MLAKVKVRPKPHRVQLVPREKKLLRQGVIITFDKGFTHKENRLVFVLFKNNNNNNKNNNALLKGNVWAMIKVTLCGIASTMLSLR